MGKYYSVNYSSSDDVIDMTEIEDTLEHKYDYLTSHTQHEGYYSPNLAEKKDLVFDNARLHTENAKNGQPPMLSLDFKGRNGGGYHFSIKLSKKLSESLNNCKNAINNAFEYGGAIRRPRDSYTLSDIELEKAAYAIYNNAIKYWGSMAHSAFNDQLASNDDKAKYYKYMSGKYDPKTKNVTLKFSNGLYNVQVVCQGSMYGRVNSLPEMKEYVQNAFYAEVGAHKYLDSSNASKAAVYLWDAKNSHFGKANPISRLQHSAFTVVPAYDKDYLEHHGILGMKWGVRRYQNANGTLTAEGRERYGIKTKSTGGNSEYSTGIDKLKSKYEKNLTDATMQRRSAIHYQNKPNGEKASKFTRASMAGALDKADRYEKKAEKIKNKAEKKYGAKFEINDRDYKEVYDEVMKYYERKTTSEIGKERAAWFGKNLILGGALGGALWSTLDLAEGKNIHSKYKIKE